MERVFNRINQTLQFHCRICSYPSSIIQWIHNENLINNNQYYSIETKTILSDNQLDLEQCHLSILIINVCGFFLFNSNNSTSI